MASYTDLLTLSTNSNLLALTRVACIVAAETIRTEADTVPNHARRLVWAKAVFENPEAESKRMLWAVLAQNKTQTTAAITAATDTQIQTAVDAAVNVFAV